MKYYKSINDINVFTFYKVADFEDPRYLIKNIKKKDLNKVSNKLHLKLIDIFENIVLEYNSKGVTSNSIKQSRSKSEIDYLESKYSTTVRILKLYSDYNQIEILFALNDLGWIFLSEKPVEYQLNSILKKLKGLRNKIKILKIKYNNEFNKLEKDNKKISFIEAMDKKALYIESTLDKKYPINTKKTKLIRWCNLLELCKIKESNG